MTLITQRSNDSIYSWNSLVNMSFYCQQVFISLLFFSNSSRGHGGRVGTLSPPTSEAGVRFPAQPQVGKLVVACRWSAVYSTEP